MTLELFAIAALVALACGLVGAFLVLRGLSMLADSITHTMLLGIVVAFFLTGSLNSPWLLFGAAAVGVVTAWLTELLTKTGLVAEDSAVGMVFPLLFSLALLLITRYASMVHLDVDTVLLGELAFAPFDRLIIAGRDVGPKALYTSLFLALLNGGAVLLFFKELKVSTFDSLLAASLGFSPLVMHYGLMTLVSLTAVGAFQAVGAVLVVAFMVGPPLTALLLTKDLKSLICLSALIGVVSSGLGLALALALDVSIAGAMALVVGLVFCGAVFCAPQKGILSRLMRRRAQKQAFDRAVVMMHLCHHRLAPNADSENNLSTLGDHLHWPENKIRHTLQSLAEAGYISLEEGVLYPTDEGLEATKALVEGIV